MLSIFMNAAFGEANRLDQSTNWDAGTQFPDASEKEVGKNMEDTRTPKGSKQTKTVQTPVALLFGDVLLSMLSWFAGKTFPQFSHPLTMTNEKSRGRSQT
jgi:hypothetical protein